MLPSIASSKKIYGMTSAFENETNHNKTMKTIEIIRNRNQIVVTELLIRLPQWLESECFGSIMGA